MRWKHEGESQDQYRCCLCCHVRTGTVFLGLFHLFVHILVLSLFAVVLLRPDLVQQQPNGELYIDVDTGEGNNQSMVHVHLAKMTNESKFVGFLVTLGSLFVTLLLIYGAVRGQPGYMMPFFCLQVFDFCITCLTIVGYISYVPNVKRWIEMQESLPFKQELMEMDSDWLMLLAIMFFVMIMTIKAYLLGIVWSCYKYLSSYQRVTGSAVVRTYSADGEDGEMLLPPKYEDAVRMAQNEPPPPAYYPN